MIASNGRTGVGSGGGAVPRGSSNSLRHCRTAFQHLQMERVSSFTRRLTLEKRSRHATLTSKVAIPASVA